MWVVELVAALALGPAGASPCPATTVHYGTTPVGVPWVAAGDIVGHLFAYGGSTLMDGRVNGSDGLVLYTRGRTPSGVTKILWRARRRFGSFLSVTGTRIDAPGSFRQRLRHAGGQFPSVLDVPAAGCWKLAVRTGKLRASFVLEAVDAPASPVCEPTVVVRDIPHPRFGPMTWMPATPRTGGIAAVLFVGTVPGAERALVYVGGHAPEGWATKFLWWSPHAGGVLRLAGRRMDAPGEFKQVEQQAIGVTPPVTGPVFPSVVDLPAAGCWAVIASTGGRAGLVVFKAVASG